MKRLLAPARTNENRRVPGCPKQLGFHIDRADVGETPRPKLDMPEGLVILLERCIIINAGCHVAKMRGRNSAPASRFEVHYVDGVSRRGNDAGFDFLLPGPSRGKDRTRCEEPKKMAPIARE